MRNQLVPPNRCNVGEPLANRPLLTTKKTCYTFFFFSPLPYSPSHGGDRQWRRWPAWPAEQQSQQGWCDGGDQQGRWCSRARLASRGDDPPDHHREHHGGEHVLLFLHLLILIWRQKSCLGCSVTSRNSRT
jgi:hypothetical protein